MPDFFEKKCQSISSRKKFGLCDDKNACPAYLDERNGANWIAVVENEYQESICFYAIDNCIDLKNEDGTQKRRCDGMLTFNTTVIFVELKDRNTLGNKWIKEGDEQLQSTISEFEKEDVAASFGMKKAYISNRAKPVFRSSQMGRMEKFKMETGYSLRIENRIKIE